jgi:hypothetical protein
MVALDHPTLLTGRTALEFLQKVPIVRGWGGRSEAHDWMTVGSGRKLQAVKEAADQISWEHVGIETQWAKWADMLSLEFVQFVRNTRFSWYQCPKCLSRI